MTRNDYEPLIVKIRNRMLCWASKALSYAGRLLLIKSVIASITNFWSSAFCLPQACMDEIESLCCAFLWSGSPNNTSSAKIAWQEVCVPREEGGLGIRRVREVGTVFSLKLIWRLLSHHSSLWSRWVHRYLLKRNCFWDVKDTAAGSWVWRKLLKLRPLAKQFVRMDINDGRSVNFWTDVWHPLGRLIDITGEIGTQQLGVRRDAKISDVLVEGNWQMRRCREPHFQPLIHAINDYHLSLESTTCDKVMWKKRPDTYSHQFSPSATWELIRVQKEKIQWRKLVWFSQGVPRFAFITWLAFKNRLSTGHCMTRWGWPQCCVYCGDPDETRDHLFFACPYTFTLWIRVVGTLLGRSPDPDWETTMRGLLNGSYDRINFILLRLVLQVTIYYIWRERNERRHNNTAKTVDHLGRLIDKVIRNRITSLGYSMKPKLQGLMRRWFQSRHT